MVLKLILLFTKTGCSAQPFSINFIRDLITFSINVPITNSRDPFFAHTPQMYIPVFTIIEFIGYLGWIKVAETLLNPWGDDDEDFQINYLIDRNFQVRAAF